MESGPSLLKQVAYISFVDKHLPLLLADYPYVDVSYKCVDFCPESDLSPPKQVAYISYISFVDKQPVLSSYQAICKWMSRTNLSNFGANPTPHPQNRWRLLVYYSRA